MKLKTILASAFLLIGGCNLWAQTDVTNLIVNPSFEYSAEGVAYTSTTELANGEAIYGWTGATISSNNKNIQVTNSAPNTGFGTTSASEGSFFYFIRQGWENKTSSITQNVTLPVGRYYITVDYKEAEQHDNGNFLDSKVGITVKKGEDNLSVFSTGGSVNAPGASYFTDIAWKKIGTWFDVTEEASINIALTFTLNGSSKRADLCLDNVKLYKWALDDQTNYDNTTKSNPMDVTAKFVTNPYFDSNANGWTSTTGSQNSGRATNKTGAISGGFFENWNGSAKTSGKMYQTLSDLPDGIYRFTASAFGDQGTAALKLYAGSSYSDLITSNTPSNYSVQTTVSGGSLEIGLNVESTNGAKWLGLDNIKLEYLGFDVDAAIAAANEQATAAKSHLTDKAYTGYIDALQDAIDDIESLDGGTATKASIQTAVNNLTTALTNVSTSVSDYANLNTEIAHANAYSVVNIANASGYAAAISAAETIYSNASEESTAATILGLQNYKVEDYNYVTTNYQYGVSLGEWVSSGSNAGANFNNEHWSGTTTNYKNQDDSNGQGWNSSAWDMDYNQNVTLPAGNYVFKVAGRQAQSNQVDMSLVVKKGEEILGSVNNFPHNGSSARGIDKTGATKFAGENDDFANSGNGFGWEWRYVKFTLASDATVNIAVKVNATALHMWASFGNYTLQTDNEANISLIAYNVALNDAITARDNATYTNVTGSEKTALLAAIAADASLDKSDKDAIDDAKDDLIAATTAFTGAKASYDAFVAAKAVEYEDNLPFASSTKFAAIGTAQGATATSASDADSKTSAIISAYRKYVESNALAEGVTGAETIDIEDPNMEVEYNGTEHTFGAWQVFGQTNGTIQLLSSQSFTDGSGKNDYKYADIYKNDNNAGIQQTVNLEPGKYLLTVTARANTTAGAAFWVFAGAATADIQRVGNTGGVFDRGWNDASLVFNVYETSDVNIGVQSGNGKDLWWSATRFRLVKLGTAEMTISEDATSAPTIADDVNVTLTRTLKADQWNTFSVPFDFTVAGSALDGAQVMQFSSIDGNVLTVEDADEIVAGEPYLIKPSSDIVNPTFEGVDVKNPEKAVKGTGDYKFKANLYNDTSLAIDGTVAYLSTDGSVKRLTSGGIKGLRAIFLVPAAVGVKEFVINFGGTDGVMTLDADGNIVPVGAAVYNLAGQQLSKVQKGVNLVSGKAVLVK